MKLPPFQHIPFVDSISYPARPGNAVRPLIDGVPAFRRICEAVEAAQHSVFLTVAFLHTTFTMPDGRGSIFDMLDSAAHRGLDVRVIFWRSNVEAGFDDTTIFAGRPRHLQWLEARGSRMGVRWDRVPEPSGCHHQKSWIVDAGHPTEVAFVGGINLNPKAMASPGHLEQAESFHDVYVEVVGPAATDVHHNFVQRWNEASERGVPGGSWGELGQSNLPFPTRVSAPRGNSRVQIQRTVRAGQYTDSSATPGGSAFDITKGERAIWMQYQQAIDAAQRTIYIENQAFEHPEIIARLTAAVDRGVEVVVLVPAHAEAAVRRARSARLTCYEQLAALGHRKHFTMIGLASPRPDGTRRDIYIHGKVMLVDDAFATIGSCNLSARSFFSHTEMNASIYNPVVVQALRRELLSEHLHVDTGAMEDTTALRLCSETAWANTRRHQCGDPVWQGIAFALEPASYVT
jgi:phosphatidylserine/phosphatidylglycerophosphate/cardiolipin synthase-like enzyme